MIKCYVGLPRSGKTTHAVKMALQYRKKYKHIYANFPCPYTILINSSDLGFYDFSESLILLDEAGIDFNNRFYKGLPKETIQFFKLHGHYQDDIIVYSQALDYDITLRRLSEKLYIIKKKRFGFSIVLPLHQYWDVDTEGQPIVKYKFLPKILILLFPYLFLFWRPRYYKYFDTHAAPKLPDYHCSESVDTNLFLPYKK